MANEPRLSRCLHWLAQQLTRAADALHALDDRLYPYPPPEPYDPGPYGGMNLNRVPAAPADALVAWKQHLVECAPCTRGTLCDEGVPTEAAYRARKAAR